MTDYAVVLVFPEYVVGTGSGGVPGLGHAGVALIDGTRPMPTYCISFS